MSPLSPHEQLWRLVTSFLFAGSGLNLLFDAFLFHRTSASLETDTYLLDGAKYAWSLLWIAVGIQVRLPLAQNSFNCQRRRLMFCEMATTDIRIDSCKTSSTSRRTSSSDLLYVSLWPSPLFREGRSSDSLGVCHR